MTWMNLTVIMDKRKDFSLCIYEFFLLYLSLCRLVVRLYLDWKADFFFHYARSFIKAGTHEGACSRSTLLQHAPGAKLPRLHQRFLAKKYVAQQNFCSRVLLKLVWYEGASSRGKTVARFCFRSKLPRVYWNLLCGSVFQEQAPPCVLKFALRHVFQERAPSCVLVGVLTREHVSRACFRSKLLRVYWLECLPGSVFRERVSGASSLVCTGLYVLSVLHVNLWCRKKLKLI